MRRRLLFISFLVVIISFIMFKEIEIYDIIKINSNETGAMCLDGSDYQFNYQKGFGSGEDNFIIFFDGGGWCSSKYYNSTLESCYKRTFTYLGSSNVGISQKIMNTLGKSLLFKRIMPFLSIDSSLNPTFYNWNKIFLTYCDGRGFVGFNINPIKHNDKNLYFRGYNNTISVLDYLKKNLLASEYSLKNVIVSGVSAGGLASLYYTNFIADYFSKINPNVKVKTIMDSGFFLDLPNEKNLNYNFGIVWKDLVNYTQPSLPPELDCNLIETWKCFLPENIYQKVQKPVFIIHSQYDTYSICNLLGTCNLSMIEYSFKELDSMNKISIDRNRLKLIEHFDNILSNKKGWTIFSPSCYAHDFLIYSFNWDKAVIINGKTIKEVLNEWISKDDLTNYIDKSPWPSNPNCAYHMDFMYYLHYFNILVDIF